MANVASHFRRANRAEDAPSLSSGSRRIVALVGRGKGPLVAFRSKKVRVRLRGLTDGGLVTVTIDGTPHEFREDGTFDVLGGEFAQVSTSDTDNIFCELLVGGA